MGQRLFLNSEVRTLSFLICICYTLTRALLNIARVNGVRTTNTVLFPGSTLTWMKAKLPLIKCSLSWNTGNKNVLNFSSHQYKQHGENKLQASRSVIHFPDFKCPCLDISDTQHLQRSNFSLSRSSVGICLDRFTVTPGDPWHSQCHWTYLSNEP